MYIIPSDLLRQFGQVSSINHSKHDGRTIETLGFLLGYKTDDNFIGTDLIFPEQEATCSHVDDKGIQGEDSLDWAFKALRSEGKMEPCLIAWIHTHVENVKCGFSSIDNHTQHTYSKLHDGVLGLVIEVLENNKTGEYDFFEITRQGKRFLEKCSRQKDCNTMEQHESCNNTNFYKSVKDQVMFDDSLVLKVRNFMDIEELNFQSMELDEQSEEESSEHFRPFEDFYSDEDFYDAIPNQEADDESNNETFILTTCKICKEKT